MRIRSAIVLGLTAAFALTGCGSDQGAGDDEGPRGPAPKVAALGPFVGECGHVTDNEVRDLGGLGQIVQSFKNGVGCNWQGSGGNSITFASYRGSPLEREKAWVTTHGRPPEPITVGGRNGFAALDPTGRICDLAVQLDDDFFEWSTARSIAGGDPCERSRALAELTIERLG
ncbi:DUF3558 domain-containing protein [Nocardia fusca]|uniref:DUF3558 domain-containing protein n=1 Tax=Nocardia fusca TaxID=941183 RepID=UPI0007A73263|nr:DUF3558 domain-containing protein [Nocardia fusca]